MFAQIGTAETRVCAVPDEAMVALRPSGDQHDLLALLNRYRWVLRSLARRYFLPGGDAKDLLQEASLGFVKAVRDNRAELSILCRVSAELCAGRQVVTAVETVTRYKEYPLNTAVSLYRSRFARIRQRFLMPCPTRPPLRLSSWPRRRRWRG